ncbi:MAG: thioredoxin domain protein [Gemmatimonadetes bacterium]|nr:thioredoxin domain protein [Gemmatimonadota bacterium]
MKKFSEKLVMLTNILVIVAFLVFIVGPNGVVYGKWKDWRTTAKAQQQIADKWPALTEGGSRLDTGKTAPAFVEFADYQCPFCKNAGRTMEQWLASNDTGVVFRHLPLTAIHPAADGAARTAICAEAQGRFRQMHHQLFADNTWEKDTNWVREATAAGVPDIPAFEACRHSEKTTARLNADMKLAEGLGIKGTPTYVARNGLRQGILTDDMLRLLTQKGQ